MARGGKSNTGSAAEGAALVVDDLCLIRRNQNLLDSCSFVVEPGETLAVMGPSGAGKTTLLRTLAGLAPPDGGRIFQPRGRVAFVFQEPRLLPWRSALANVELVLPDEQRPRAKEWLERVGLADAMHVLPGALSGGMRQRVAIARALACDASLLLVDEPFASLDADTATRLRDLLVEELRLLQRPAVWVTHNAAEALAVAPRILHVEGPPTGGWSIAASRPVAAGNTSSNVPNPRAKENELA